VFKLSQKTPSASTGTLTLVYLGNIVHSGFDNCAFLTKNQIVFVEDAGDTLHTQRNALDSAYVLDVTTDYSQPANQPIRILAEGRDASATIDSGFSGLTGFQNEGDNELTGFHVSNAIRRSEESSAPRPRTRSRTAGGCSTRSSTGKTTPGRSSPAPAARCPTTTDESSARPAERLRRRAALGLRGPLTIRHILPRGECGSELASILGKRPAPPRGPFIKAPDRMQHPRNQGARPGCNIRGIKAPAQDATSADSRRPPRMQHPRIQGARPGCNIRGFKTTAEDATSADSSARRGRNIRGFKTTAEDATSADSRLGLAVGRRTDVPRG
jgi:hypothetical protein